MAVGTYTGTGEEVINVTKDVTISGGWNEAFTEQRGRSTLDGEKARRGITIFGRFTLVVERLVIQNGLGVQYRGGGGIQSELGTLTVRDSIIQQNVAENGAGIKNWGGTATISNSIIRDNTSSLGGGGGVAAYSGSTTIINSTISGNTVGNPNFSSGSGGGGIENAGSTLRIINSTISGNRALYTYPASAIAHPGSTSNTTIENSTISGNSGAEVVVDGFSGTMQFNNVTIANNQGIGLRASTSISIQNSILFGNTNGDCGVYAGIKRMRSLGHNVVGTTTDCEWAASDKIGADPLLESLQDNGGPTQTHALRQGSPAIRAGNAATCSPADQRGVQRFTCDSGAFQAIQSLFVPLARK